MTEPTHFAWPDDRMGGESPWTIYRALCGVAVRVREIDNHPTCPVCAKTLADWDARDPEEET